MNLRGKGIRSSKAGRSVGEALRSQSASQQPAKASASADRMNQTERAYSEVLEGRRLAGEITAWWFEAIKLVLGHDCVYNPDFLVQLADGSLELHEVKGFWRDDARVKVQVAARLYPFRIRAVQKLPKKSGGGWQFEEIQP